MSLDFEFRFIERGRPEGSFEDPAYRVRAWHWLGEVMALAGVDDVTVLDRFTPRHALSKGLSVARRFESVHLDGYDPGGTTAIGKCSLLKHVASQEGYATTLASCDHVFWRLLLDRNAPNSPTDKDLQALLREQGLVRLGLADQANGETLGLINAQDYAAATYQEESDELLFNCEALVNNPTLDGLQLLLLLYREAQDFAQHRRAQRIASALGSAADAFAKAHRYSGEAYDTWHLLVQTRMLRWHPGFQPTAKALQQATSELLYERRTATKRKGKRGTADPTTYVRGRRTERRWRRQIWARACRLSFQKPEPHLYVSPALGDWLVKHRALIEAHTDRAVDLLMDGDPAEFLDHGRTSPLPSLVMPGSLYRRRKRPKMDDETWRHFGDHLPFDVIPVQAVDDGTAE